jgi:lysophospholipase L1-like esterase
MPFGDSITEGCCNFVGGYRVELFRQARQEGHDITFVGSVSNGPTTVDGVPFPRDHEGHGGYTIDDEPARGTNGISPFVGTSLPSYTPNIITLMIGTNDINGNIDVADAPNRLGTLLDSIHAQDPDVLVVLAQIVPTQNDGTNQAVQTYNAAMPQLVSDRVALGYHLILVDMYAAFTQDVNYKNTLLADGLHPNDAGYALMGQTWYAAISDYLR